MREFAIELWVGSAAEESAGGMGRFCGARFPEPAGNYSGPASFQLTNRTAFLSTRRMAGRFACFRNNPMCDKGFPPPPAAKSLPLSGSPAASRLAFGIWNELVTYTSDGKQVKRLGRILLNIPAQAHDEIVDGPCVGILM